MQLLEYLAAFREKMPDWLEKFTGRGRFPAEEFFKSRIVYYPGAWIDGQPVKVFGSTHSAHCFVYVDFHYHRDELQAKLDRMKDGFRGYRILRPAVPVSLADLNFTGEWKDRVHALGRGPNLSWLDDFQDSSFLQILERHKWFKEDHGPRRLAILFIRGDGITVYDPLFCYPAARRPFAVLLQDHGFGGNYDRFGRGGLLEQIATERDVMPEMLLVGANTEPWSGFAPVPGVHGECGGMHGINRRIYRQNLGKVGQD